MIVRSSSALVRAGALGLLCLMLPLAHAYAQARAGIATVRRVAIWGSERGVEVEVTSSQPIPAQTQLIADPDRLIIDFPGALPGNQLRGLTVNRGGIKAVRVGLFQASPPVTRVVLDLDAPSTYQLFPTGNAVIVKLGAGLRNVAANTVPSVISAVQVVRTPISPPLPPPRVRVDFHNGLLSIIADKASLAEVLYEVQLRTGADIAIPSGAEQEKVVVKAGPGPAKDVLAALLNGSRFNFILQGSAKDPDGLGSVLLTPRIDQGQQQAYDPPAPSPEVPEAPVAEQGQQMEPPTVPSPPPLQPEEVMPPEIPAEPPPPPQ